MIEARIRKAYAAGPDSAGFSLEAEFRATSGVIVLFGPRGAGKTLMLDAIAGLVKPDDGRILLDDQILFDAGARVNLPPQSRRCGYVFQDYALFPHMTLRQNLVFAAASKRLPPLERHRKVSEMLERFGLSEVSGQRPAEVSSGQRQRCSIARALIGQPKLLLLDEPARGLDAPLRAELHRLLRQARTEFGIPVLMVTRDLEECFELAEEMLVLDAGRLVQSGTPRQILDQPASAEVARLLGTFNLLPVQITALDPDRKTSRLRLGQVELTGPYFPGRLRGDRVMLCVRPDELLALAADGKPGLNRLAAKLIRVVERPRTARLEFAGEIVVEMPRSEYEERKHNREWVVEFPPQCLRVL